jgi:hypothetical protein
LGRHLLDRLGHPPSGGFPALAYTVRACLLRVKQAGEASA